MNIIKNIRKIEPLLTEKDVGKLEAGAALHARHANITFKVLSDDGKNITVQAQQGKSAANNHLTQKELIQRTKDLFQPFLPARNIRVHATPYKEHYCHSITPEWVVKKMSEKNIRIKDIEQDTGLEKSNISAWISGLRPMSNIVKAMFYYYFLKSNLPKQKP